MLELNKIYNMDCIEGLKQLDNDCIDLVVTSPPYYNSGHKYQRGTGFHYDRDVGEPLYIIFDMLTELYSKLKKDGMVCIDLCFSYSETGVMRPFDIINRARSKIGYFVNDLIIWHKNNPIPLQGRLTNSFEMIFVLSKHPIGKYYTKQYTHNVWDIPVSGGIKGHSAVYPLELSNRCIKHFSKENDLVVDTFIGSGTTAVSAKQLNRHFIGFEINKNYCKIANTRLEQEYIKFKSKGL